MDKELAKEARETMKASDPWFNRKLMPVKVRKGYKNPYHFYSR